MRVIKGLIKKMLKKVGRDSKIYNPTDEILLQNKNKWLKDLNIKTIIDVGANEGGFASKIRQIFPDAMIYSFEPIEDCFNKLRVNFEHDKFFKAFNVACSNTKGSSAFNINSNSGSSSMLKIGRTHLNAYPDAIEQKIIEIETVKLDQFFNDIRLTEPVLLKIDVQGAEKKVLEGARELLKKIKIVFIELSFQSLYNGQPLAGEIVTYMYDNGFNFTGVENVSQNINNGMFLQADAFFVAQ